MTFQMGGDNSKFVIRPKNEAFVGLAILGRGRIRVFNAPEVVIDMLAQLEAEINQLSGCEAGRLIPDYFGTVKITIGESYGQILKIPLKIFVMRFCQEMHKLGYSFSQSCDLVRSVDNATMYFYKNPILKSSQNPRICCIDTGKMGVKANKLILLYHDEDIKGIVRKSISESWPKGLESEHEKEVVGKTLHNFVLKGGYWGGTHEDGINTRLLLCSIIGNMASAHWRLLASTNLEGDNDTFFFVYDPNYTATPQDFIAVALAKHERLRMINCQFLEQPLVEACKNAGQNILGIEDYHGSKEIILGGSPWWCSGDEAIRARRTISRIMETMNSLGWSPMTGVDISRRLTDKTTFLFQRTAAPIQVKFAAVSNTDFSTMRLLDFPSDVRDAIINVLETQYVYGIDSKEDIGEGNIKIKFGQMCWVYGIRGAASFHIRAAIGAIMKTAESYGWYPTISGDISARFESSKDSSDPVDVHTIFFSKIRGMLVVHELSQSELVIPVNKGRLNTPQVT